MQCYSGGGIRMGFEIRAARASEVEQIIAWAAAEGWNPGLQDAACFRAQDPDGLLVGLVDGVMVSAISVANYGPDFAFLGLYITQPEYRGRGYGLAVWQAGLKHAGQRTVGLDGVPAQQANYRRAGFSTHHGNSRYGGMPTLPAGSPNANIIPATQAAFAALVAYDAGCFPAERPDFLRHWISAPGHIALALQRQGHLAGYGVLRPCREGSKIGPLFADDTAAAEALFGALLAQSPQGPVFIDCPETNPAARKMAETAGLSPSFATARMLTGPIRPILTQRVFGITSLELG